MTLLHCAYLMGWRARISEDREPPAEGGLGAYADNLRPMGITETLYSIPIPGPRCVR